jgi:threonine synthase
VWQCDGEEIVEGIKLLARTEGIFTEPAGGTEVAVTRNSFNKDEFRVMNRSLLASPVTVTKLSRR